MEKKQKQPRTVILKPLPGFQPGHARLGGRTKRTAAQARSLADELGVDPLAYLLNLLAVDVTEEIEFTPDGTERRVKLPVTRELKIDICKTLAVFFYPRLNSTAVSSPDGGPVEVEAVTLGLDRIMADPALCEMAQSLSIAMTEAGRTPAPALPQIAAPGESSGQRDVLADLAKDDKGHWAK